MQPPPLDDPLLLRHARRIVAQLPKGGTHRLLIEVALASYPSLFELSAPQKEAISQLVVDHVDGSYPLPHRGTRYSRREWDRIRGFSLRNHADIRAYDLEVERWERLMSGELPKDLYNSLYGSASQRHPRQAVNTLFGWLRQELATIPPTARIPSRLREVWRTRARPSLERSHVRLKVLGIPWLYRRGTDLQRIVDALRNGPARSDIECILTAVHNVRFPPSWHRDLPNIYDVLDARVTVIEMQQAVARREANLEERRRYSEVRHMTEIVQLAHFLAPDKSPILSSLNRRLKHFAPRLRCVRTISSGRAVAVIEGFDSGWRFMGPRDSVNVDVVDALFKELRRVALAIRAAGGPERVEDFWMLRSDCSST